MARSGAHMQRSSLPAACSRPQAGLWNLRAVGCHENPYGLAQKSPVFPGIRHLELQQSADVPGTDKLTVFSDGHDIPPDVRADLAHRNIPVVDGRIVEIAHDRGRRAAVKLDTGPSVAVDILFAHPRNKPSASLHESLGLATVDTPVGIVLKVDERRQTSMPGIYAAGDLTTPFLPSVTQASLQGAMAGIFAQQSMLV